MLLQTVARVIISDTRGTLAEQVERRARAEGRVPRLAADARSRADDAASPPSSRDGADLARSTASAASRPTAANT